jgi:hypothetical protein
VDVIRKGQAERSDSSGVLGAAIFVESLFGVAAQGRRLAAFYN